MTEIKKIKNTIKCCRRIPDRLMFKDKNGHILHVGRECTVCKKIAVDAPFYPETKEEKKLVKQGMLDIYFNANLRFVK